ncbi:MAG: hypothetical protein ACT4PW_11830 [Acidimicrobiia bacterium]
MLAMFAFALVIVWTMGAALLLRSLHPATIVGASPARPNVQVNGIEPATQ